MKHGWPARSPLASQLRARLGVVTAMDVLIFTVDSRLLFPVHLDFAKMPKAGPGDQEWRQNLSSFARPECEACIQIVSARRGNQNLPSPQELRTSRRIWYLWPSTDHWRFLVSKWNVYSITYVCVNRKCLLVCTCSWLLSQLCRSLSLFSYFHESKQAKAAHTNKLKNGQKKKGKKRNEEKCTNQHKI